MAFQDVVIMVGLFIYCYRFDIFHMC
jgi:hypothetical protein